MSDEQPPIIAGEQPEFWITQQQPGISFYPTPISYYTELHYNSLIAFNDRPWNRYYARKVVNVRFTEAAGLQVPTYDLTDVYDYLFTLFIQDQPDEETLMLCKWINGQLYSFGSAGRNNGGYA